MTIDEVKIAKAHLEQHVKDVLNEFHETTGLSPTSVHLDRVTYISMNKPQVSAVRIDVEL